MPDVLSGEELPGNAHQDSRTMEEGSGDTNAGPGPAVTIETPVTSFKYKLLLQIAVTNVYVAKGAFAEIIGPTLQDLMEMLGVTYEAIAAGLAVRAVGFALGAVVGGVLHDVLGRRPPVLIMLGLLCAALGIVLIPYATSIRMFSMVVFLPGLGRGILTVGGVVQTMAIWREKSAGPVQALYFAYDLGAILMTETVRPFLSSEACWQNQTINNSTNVTDGPADNLQTGSAERSYGNHTVTPHASSSANRLAYPFIIVAVYTTLAAIIILVFYIRDSKLVAEPRRRIQCAHASGAHIDCTPAHVRAAAITLCASLYCFHSNGGEQNFMTYLFSYAVDSELSFTKNRATSLTSVARFALFIGRFCAIFVSHFFRVQYLIISTVLVLIATFTCMSLLNPISETVCWILVILAGMSISVQYAAGMSLANLYVETSSLVSMIWFMGAGLGLLCYEYTTGYLFDKYGIHTFSYTMLICATSLLLTFIIMQTLASFHQNRFTEDTK